MREGTSFTIRDSRVLGGTRHVKIYGCYMSKLQENEVFWSWVATGKQRKEKEIIKVCLGLWLVGSLVWACVCVRPSIKQRRRKKIIKDPFGGNLGFK